MKFVFAAAAVLLLLGRADSQTSTAPSPGGRNKPGFVYDSAKKKFLLFGGSGQRGEGVKGDTWEWDGRQWARVDAAGPSPRAAVGMAYDGKRRRAVLFGGFGPTPQGDTWEWDGKTWKQVMTAGPSARAGSQMVYD